MRTFLICFSLVLCVSCTQHQASLTKQEAIGEIYEVEQAFNDMLAKEGRAVAFAHFAAEDGGIQRSGRMIVGKDSIFAFYDKSTTTDIKLTWKPDRVDVSDDFTMAYTWGRFAFSGTRASGEKFENTGVFHTVWKRQPNGSWRYVYD